MNLFPASTISLFDGIIWKIVLKSTQTGSFSLSLVRNLSLGYSLSGTTNYKLRDFLGGFSAVLNRASYSCARTLLVSKRPFSLPAKPHMNCRDPTSQVGVP